MTSFMNVHSSFKCSSNNKTDMNPLIKSPPKQNKKKLLSKIPFEPLPTDVDPQPDLSFQIRGFNCKSSSSSDPSSIVVVTLNKQDSLLYILEISVLNPPTPPPPYHPFLHFFELKRDSKSFIQLLYWSVDVHI